MSNMRKRYLFDVLLSAVLIFEMFYQFTGNFLHEVVGMAFAACIVLHLVFSRKWVGATKRQISRRKLTPANAVRLVLAVLLCVTMVVLLVSSLAISNALYGLTGIDLVGGSYATWAVVHSVAAYALCAFTVVHLTVHWASAASVLKIPYNHQRRQAISVGVGAVAGLGVLLIGANAVSAIGGPLAGVAEAAGASSNARSGSATGDKGVAAGDGGPSASVGDGPASSAGVKGPSESAASPSAKDGKPAKPVKPGKPGDPDDFGPSSGREIPDDLIPQASDNMDGRSSDAAGISGSGNAGSAAPDEGFGGSSPDGAPGSGSESSSDVSGYCTLCRKHCPLSAPQCNEPYLRGLI